VTHLIGIGGIGMSALARLLAAAGESVCGSDLKDSPLLARLRREGVEVRLGHSAENVTCAERVVYSSAIDRTNPEYLEARRRGIPLVHRGELLAELMRGRRGIAICGTHGKTTTTAMTYAVLRSGRIDASLALGGIDVALGTNAIAGSDPWFAAEADESDGSFVLLEPEVAVVTNIENDHLSSEDDLPRLIDAFAEFIAHVPENGLVVVGSDNAPARSLLARRHVAPALAFGLDGDAQLHATNLRSSGVRTSFDVIADGVSLGNVDLSVPGTMNVRNALAAIAVGRHLEIPFARITAALRIFRGVRRRFEILCHTQRMVVIDDYAHHPTAIRETIAAARAYHAGSLVVAFQPHRYTRTALLAQEFAHALSGADRVYLVPIYAASEPPLPGVNAASIGEPLAAMGGNVTYVKNVDELDARIASETPHGSLVLMLGAGDITDAAARLASRIQALQQSIA
jgi:UDP-N-acetylmuramate--alanine ligase